MRNMWDSLRQDARFAIRQLASARSFAVAAVGTLAIGIGATVAMFSVVEAVILRPFPFASPDRVVNLHPARDGVPLTVASNLEFATWRALPRGFDGVAALYSGLSFVLTRGDAPEFYIPFEQMPPPLWSAMQGSLTIVARTASDPATMERAVRGAVAAFDPSLPVAQVATMESLVATSRASARFNTLLLCLLGAIALVLASVGVYGVIAYSVTQRTREIGLRMALGATPRTIAALVARQGLTPIAAGAVIGGALSVLTTRLLREQLYGVAPGDPATIIAIAGLLMVVSLVAACVPTRRAMAISPVTALTT